MRDLLLGSPRPRCASAPRELDEAELAMMDDDDEPTQMAYAHAIAD